MKQTLTPLFIILILLFPAPSGVFAHPHVFIEQRLKIVFDEKGMAGIHVNWRFDDMFSTMIADDHDTDKDNRLDPAEVARIKEKAFGYIAEYNYFFTVKIDGTPFPVKYVTDFSAELDNGKLVYDFFIPCHVTAIKGIKKLLIASYDPNYYSAIYFADKAPYAFVNNGGVEANADVRIDKDTLIYFETVNPWTLFLDFRRK